MYSRYRDLIYENYHTARDFFIAHPQMLSAIEHYAMTLCCDLMFDNYAEFRNDYDEASFLHPFWANYPPENRGRAPVGDQIPWIEVGEHAIGDKLNRMISNEYTIREIGIPSGADNRFLLSSPVITEITNDFTDSIMLFLDIKSVGPRDDFEHTVISPYQVSGNGLWDDPTESVFNSPMRAIGKIKEHQFYPAIPPIYALSDGIVAPTVHLFIKPIYKMLNMENYAESGQPLKHIRVACLPNGLLLTENPNYLRRFPGLLFPGKDEKSKRADKMRCRVSFDLLTQIDRWRVTTIRR